MEILLNRLSADNFDPRLSRRNLSYFYAAATLGNFTKAAQACGVAQPSLSRGIVLVEDAVGTALFDRAGRSVTLSPKGAELLPQVELYLNQSIDFTAALASGRTGTGAEVKLASVSSLTSDVLPRLLTRFEALNTGTRVRLMDGINSEVVRAVDAGDADLGIVLTQEDPARFRSQPLFSDQYCLVVNSTHRFFGRDDLRWEELNREAIATFEQGSNTYATISGVFSEIGMYFAPAACVRFRSTLMGLVKHRGLAAILPQLVLEAGGEDGLKAIPLTDPVLRRTYCLVDRKGRFKKEQSHALEAFLRFELMAMENQAVGTTG